jgi:hypothetical protein
MTPQSGDRFEEFPTPAQGIRMSVRTPPNGGPGPRAIAVFAGVAGLIAGAAVASGIWLLFGNDGGSSSAVAAPERIGDYRRFADVVDASPDAGSDDARKRVTDRYLRYDRESSARLSASHDGAGAVVQQYSDEDLEANFSLEVVRAPSPFPQYVPFSDPEDLGTDKPVEEALVFGRVSCAVRNNAGQSPIVLNCLRTTDDLTVTVSHVTGDLLEQPEEVAKLVDQAWSQLD